MLIKTRFTHDTYNFDQENKTHLVITLQAPKIEWQQKRPRICVIPVIDVSGSMAGSKLDYAKQSAMKLVEHLGPGDYCGLVTFDSYVIKVQPPVEMTHASKDRLKASIGKLRAGSSTNFSGGMLQGFEWANQADLPSDVIRRVIMFTDGQANVGVRDRTGLLKLVEGSLGAGTCSAFGYGTDADQDLLADIAAKGKGNYAFIKSPEDALTAFGKELGGLLSTYAQDITLDVAVHNGHVIQQVVSDVDVEEKEAGKRISIKVPELLSEEERHIVLEVTLSKQSQALPREMTAVDFKVDYTVFDDGKKATKTAEAKAKVQFVKPGDAQKEPHKDLAEIVGIQQLVQTQVEAEKLADRGDYRGAQALLERLGSEFDRCGLDNLRKTSGQIRGRFASRESYSSSKGILRSIKTLGTRAVGLSEGDDEAVSMMSNYASVQLDNSAQKLFATEFQSQHAAPDPAKIAAIMGADEDYFLPFTPASVPAPCTPSEIAEVAEALKAATKVKLSTSKAAKKPRPKVSKSKSKRW